MWTIVGPFDDLPGQANKAKLLKPGNKYRLGRHNDVELTIVDKRISREHVVFTVGPHSLDDSADATVIPTLTYHNPRTKPVSLERAGQLIAIEPSSSIELQSEDRIAVVSTVAISVSWRPVCCLADNTDLPIRDCAALGIKTVVSHSPLVTHHILPTLTPTAPVITSLLSSIQLVKPEWLTELIRIANLPRGLPPGQSSLEDTWEWLPEANYRPKIGSDLPQLFKDKKGWDPNQARQQMLAGLRFCFVSEAGSITEELKTLVSRGGGEYTATKPPDTIDAWTKLLSGLYKKAETTKPRGMKSGVVLIADDEAMQAALGSTWKDLILAAKSVGLQPLSPSRIGEAIFKVDRSLIDSGVDPVSGDSQSSIPDFVTTTYPQDPSQLPQSSTSASSRPRRRLMSPSPGPVEPPQPLQLPTVEGDAPRKPRRRTNKKTIEEMMGIDGPSIVVESEPLPTPAAPATVSALDPSAPAPVRSSRLKRRAVTTAASSQPFDLGNDTAEPPLKKFRSLFEESDPDRPETMPISESQVESSQLPPVAEEEEDNPPTTESVKTGTKRKSSAEDADSQTQSADTLVSKRRAVESVPPSATQPLERTATTVSVTSQPKKKLGAPPGEPDRNENVLLALASRKRGKRTEDEFDREFNNLRISKPDTKHVDRDREMEAWDNMEKDYGIRGNFMVVVETDCFRKDGGAQGRRLTGGRPEWIGKPDFKKFKKKAAPGSRTSRVEVFYDEGPDYGVGTDYWVRGKQSQDSQTQLPQAPSRPKKPALRVTHSDDEVTSIDPAPTSRTKGKATKPQSQSQAKRKRTQTQTNARALFLPNSDSDSEQEVAQATVDKIDSDDDAAASTLRSSNGDGRKGTQTQRSSRTRAVSKKPAEVVVLDSDSDGGMTFKGFGGRKKGR